MSTIRNRARGIAFILGASLVAACSVSTEAPVEQITQRVTSGTRVIAVSGNAVVDGRATHVEILVQVSAGPNGMSEGRATLKRMGVDAASTEGGDLGYTFTGLIWPSFPVEQLVNDSRHPSGVSFGEIMDPAQFPWTDVLNSPAELIVGASTDACPSLVNECKGAQKYNSLNEVAWLKLRERNVLGVTWSGYGPEGPEADVAMNTSFNWTTDEVLAASDSGVIDAASVLLHEFGHVLGIGHSTVTGAVMEPVYAGPRRALHSNDAEALSSLYGSCSLDSDCDDRNACTANSCVTGECVSLNISGSCDDGEACTEGDSCSEGLCSGASVQCDAGESCDEAGDCVAGSTCGDGSCDASESCDSCAADCACEGSGQCDTCSSDGDCASGSRCFQLGDESAPACHESCSKNSDCDAGFSCSRVTRGYGKRCVSCL